MIGNTDSAWPANSLYTLDLINLHTQIGTAMHELLHAVGFSHHHMRPDRDRYLTIHYENIRNQYKSQFKKLTNAQDKLLTPFDYQSIMMYGNSAFRLVINQWLIFFFSGFCFRKIQLETFN